MIIDLDWWLSHGIMHAFGEALMLRSNALLEALLFSMDDDDCVSGQDQILLDAAVKLVNQ
jgi:hypothetical protein